MPDASAPDRGASGPAFPVVGLGGSAGGLKPLIKFFETMPPQNGMAFVVILHLSPSHASNLDSILSGVTSMPVIQVRETVKIERDHVYVISPTTNLKMFDGHLDVSPQGERPPRPVAIDLFFRTLADVHREHAMCVVMSGTGSDGAVGLSRVKERGGVVFAQSPDEAEYAAMPQNAIRTGMVDFVLGAADMPAKVLSVAENSRHIMLPPSEDVAALVDPSSGAEEALRGVISVLRTRTGHDFSHYKRATVLRRIERRMQVCQVRTLPEYLKHLIEHSAETAPLIGDMLIGVTNFFRDRAAFEALERNVIPKLFDGKENDDEVRVWVAGCASGEEAYSIAILLLEAATALGRGNVLRVFASDIDDDAIARARRGLYPESIAADVTAARLEEFFVRESSGYCVSRRVREMVLFANHDLIRDPPFSRIDLVSCRNVLIYLNRDMQAQVLGVLHFALRSGKWLFLGSAESVESAPELFELQDKKNHIAVAKSGRSDRRPLPVQPGWSGLRTLGYAELGARQDRITVNELHQRVLEQYAPPSVIVDQRYDIVHLSERAGRYLQIGGGQASLNLLKSVPAELRSPLRTLLFEATEHGTNVQAKGVIFHRDDGAHKLDLHVRPVPDSAFRGSFLLVLFDEVDGAEPVQEVTVVASTPATTQLEQELERAREQIQTTIEKYEAQNEELTASNEELQALNEELRSTTEELETSKEELQSINEELLTVNHELKNKVEEAQHVNDDMENLIASIDIGVIFLDQQLRIKRFTHRAADIFNIIEGDVGRPLLDITHRLRYDELAEDAKNVFTHAQLLERELRREDGRWFGTRMRPYRTADGSLDGAVLTFHDITERRLAEERLHMAEVRARMILEGARDYAIISIDGEGKIISWSDGAQRMFRWTPEEAVNQHFEILFAPEDREHRVPAEEMRRAREQGGAEDERWHVRKGGERFYASGILRYVRDEGDFYVKIARDLTERQQTEAAREALLARERAVRGEMERASGQKDQFLATLSHELRNPLNLIQLQAEIILRNTKGGANPQLERAAQIIRQTVGTQAQLINDLFDTSRLQTGKFTLHQQLLPLTFVVADCLGAIRQDAASKQVVIEVDLTPEPLIVEADPVRVRQIAWNLLTNAVKFTPARGRVKVKLTKDGEEARLEVSDNGAGIAPETLPHIYDMFLQADTGTTREHGGLGIGLALVKQLVEMHRGRIEAQSDGIGRGARFTVWLPLDRAALPAVKLEDLERERRLSAFEAHPSPPPGGKLAGLRVLVVDDTAENAESLGALLGLEGALVRIAMSAEEALLIAEQRDFDCIVSDIAMPNMDGHALLTELRKRPRTKTTPAIALTGYDRAADAARAHDAGFDEHVAKPADIEQLVDMILRLSVRQIQANT